MGPGRKSRRPAFSQRGSFGPSREKHIFGVIDQPRNRLAGAATEAS